MHPNSSANPENAASFLVHNYTHIETLEPDVINAAAREMIHAATFVSDWSSIGQVSFINYDRSPTMCVEYKPVGVLSCLTEAANTTVLLKNWGSPIDETDNIFSLEELEEFKSSDFSSCLYEKIKPHDAISSILPIGSKSTSQKNNQELYSAIPQPHIHPSNLTRTPGPSKLVPYRKVKPIPIVPCMGTMPPSPYARCAWLIPVRGSFPWDQCTSAIILEPNFIIPTSSEGDRPITWTHKSLQSLWEFLLDIKRRGTAGTIGLSFQISRGASATENRSLSNATFPTISTTISTATHDEGSVTSSRDVTRFAHRIQLSNVDHIKIYHEATFAMHLRNMLHLWSYAIPLDVQSSSKKVRVLRGARLALVDEGSRGILLS